MKLILILTILTLLLQNCTIREISPTTDTLNDSDTSIYTVVEKMPLYSNCKFEVNFKDCSDKKILEYFYQNIKYNPISKDDAVESMIQCSFIIEKDGTTSNIEILKGNGLSNIKDVIGKMPLWKPGEQKGLKKRVKILIPIRIHWK